MALLALGYLAVSLDDDNSPSPRLDILVATLSAVFITEFTLRCWDAPSRRTYAQQHWVDIVACIPLLGWFRTLQVLRLIRLGMALRTFRLADDTRDVGPQVRQSMWFVGPSIIALWVGGAYAMWVFEHGHNPNMHNFGDALYWSFITATTVGYGDITPQTVGGRIVSGTLVFLGLGLLGFASARLTAYWLRDDQSDRTADELRALRQEVAQLSQTLAHLSSTGQSRPEFGTGEGTEHASRHAHQGN
jgi:voltage-gated potassium channel